MSRATKWEVLTAVYPRYRRSPRAPAVPEPLPALGQADSEGTRRLQNPAPLRGGQDSLGASARVQSAAADAGSETHGASGSARSLRAVSLRGCPARADSRPGQPATLAEPQGQGHVRGSLRLKEPAPKRREPKTRSTLRSSELECVAPAGSQSPRSHASQLQTRALSSSAAYTPPGATTLSPGPPLPTARESSFEAACGSCRP